MEGRTFAKGLGVHSTSDVRYNLAGACSTFAAEVGLDDEVGARGSVIFQVFADGVKYYDSGIMWGNMASKPVNLSVAGRNQLQLVVLDAGDGNGSDHADWANAQVNCGSTGTTNSPPIVMRGQRNVTISGVKITNPSGPCIWVTDNSADIRITNSELGPCAGGVLVEGGTNITIDNNYIHDLGSAGNGVDVTFSVNVNINNNRMERIRTGIYILRSTGVKIDKNRFLNVVGPLPRGQYVQFNHVYGTGNRITCNVGQNVLGESYVVEAINLYDTWGEPNDWIQVIGNKIQGGGPSGSSGAILLGDAGGAYQTARDNIIVDPGQQGIGVGGGHDISVLNNQIYARQQAFTNVGLYVWNQDASSCYNITVQGNAVNWTASNGTKNPSWNAGNCGTVNGWASNNWNATFGPEIQNQTIAACQ
jgi:parallel beta-helix repeat protein